MLSLAERVDACIATRNVAAELALRVLTGSDSKNEKTMHDALLKAMGACSEIHPMGWYDPPPGGVSVLLADSADMRRLNFDSLRNEKFWPSEKHALDPETMGFIYLSPVDRISGMIGDYGFTFYRGKNERTRKLLREALEITEDIAEHTAVGMRLKDVADFTQKQLAKHGLQQGKMLLMNDPTGVNYGHTIPWSYEKPTDDEQKAIAGNPIRNLKNIISAKRVYVNHQEEFVITENCALTVEPRVVCVNDKGEPELFYFHLIVTFQGGKKYVPANFNRLFEALGMDFIRSRFDG